MQLSKGSVAPQEERVWVVSPSDSAYDAIALMADKHIGAVPVCVDRRVVGIVSERDCLRRITLANVRARDTSVQDIMTSPVITVPIGTALEVCRQLMVKHNIRHLPVLGADELIDGMISARDVLNATVADQNVTIDQLERYIMGI